MARQRDDLTGRKFNRLTAVEGNGKDPKSGNYLWLCRCDCGQEVSIKATELKNLKRSSCGCLAKENRRRFARIRA